MLSLALLLRAFQPPKPASKGERHGLSPGGPSPVSRDNSVRRFAQDDDFVASLTKITQNKVALMGVVLDNFMRPCGTEAARSSSGSDRQTQIHEGRTTETNEGIGSKACRTLAPLPFRSDASSKDER